MSKLTRKRKRELRNEARRFASAIVGGMEMPEHWFGYTDEEQIVACDELKAIATRLNLSRTDDDGQNG